MRKINIEKLVTIKNYNAGKCGNMLVALDENLSIEGMYGKKGDKNINLLICTATVDTDGAAELEKYVDATSPVSRIIIVSKKFLKLGNKKQLALLEIQNRAMQLATPETSESRRLYGEYCAVEKFGKITVCLARKKEQSVKNKSLGKAVRGVHRAYLKQQRKQKRAARNSIFSNLFKPNCFDVDDDLFDDLDDEYEEEVTTSAAQEPATNPA